MCISFSPYFGRDAFMHHPMHVLDAAGCGVSHFQLVYSHF